MQWELRPKKGFQIEVTHGSSRQEGVDLALFCAWECLVSKLKKSFRLCPCEPGQKEFGLVDGEQSKEKHGDNRSLKLQA